MEINLNENNIAGTLNYAFGGAGVSKLSGNGTVNQVDVNTPLASFNQGNGVTITTLNLVNVAPATYTNNGKIITANITDTDARFLNQGNATVDTLTVNTPIDGTVTLGGDAPLGNVVVTQAGSVDVLGGTIIADLEVNGSTTVNNAGTITGLSGTGEVTVTNSGNGTVEDFTNQNVTVTLPGVADQSLIKGAELVETAGVHSATFTWASTNGVGTKLVEKSNRYNYFNDGAYLDITVKGEAGNNVAFDTLFEDMTLVTDGGNVDSIKGTGGRQGEDWIGTNASAGTNYATKLKVDNSNSVFYGVRQTGKTTNLGMTRTVGFNAGDSRSIILTLTPKADLEEGIYTVTVQPKQQTGVTSGDNLGTAIKYTITI